MGQVHSPGCQITWTETAPGSERFAFEDEWPIDLRFGLRIEPALWTSGVFTAVTLIWHVVQVHHSGEVIRYRHHELVDLSTLPGAPGPDLWVGMAIGQAFQLTESAGSRQNGVFDFRPAVHLEPTGGRLGEFAVPSERHSFVLLPGRPGDGFQFPFERFIGGPGRPT